MTQHSAALLMIVLLLCSRPADAEQVRWKELKFASINGSGFKRINLPFTNVLSEQRIAENRVFETGSGVAAGDFNGDGLCDLFFASLNGDGCLLKNLGDFKFQDVTATSEIRTPGLACRGAAFADLDGDRDLDLLATATGRGVLCFVNDGTGKFSHGTARANTASPFGSMTLALADVDGNGTLDLYVTNYRTNDVRDAGQVDLQSINGKLVVPLALQSRFFIVEGQVQEFGEPDLLYLNDGKGAFTPVPWIRGRFKEESGASLQRAPFDWGLTAAFRDLNGDGSPDIYVCNDYWTPDRIWVNDGHGHFSAMSGAALRQTSASSMGVAFADFDRDGHVDFFVVDMLARARSRRLMQMAAYTGPAQIIGDILDRPQINRNTLFRNRGDGTFEEIAEFCGLGGTDWSWQPLSLDVDLDGFPDILVASGHTKDVQDIDANDEANRTKPKWQKQNGMVNYHGKTMPFQHAFTRERERQLRLYPDYHAPFYAFRNNGTMRFEEMTFAWGLLVPAIRHGGALADLDNDGDMDIIVNTLNSGAEIWINEAGAPRVAVELYGRAPNTGAIGAKVTLRDGAVPVQIDEVTAGGQYLSSSQPRLMFAPGRSPNMTIEVFWRSGARTSISNVAPNRLYQISETTVNH